MWIRYHVPVNGLEIKDILCYFYNSVDTGANQPGSGLGITDCTVWLSLVAILLIFSCWAIHVNLFKWEKPSFQWLKIRWLLGKKVFKKKEANISRKTEKTATKQSDLDYAKSLLKNMIYPRMGTIAYIANVDYRLSFADQGKQTSVVHFRLQ